MHHFMSALPARVWLIVGLVMLNQPSLTAAATAQKVETINASDIRSGAANFNGRIQEAQEVFDSDGNESKTPPKEPLFQQYGIRTFTAFEKHPELVSSLKKLNPKFNPHQMGTSSLSSIATFDGRTLLILSGCFPHNCGGTQQIVAFEPSTRLVYLLQPTNVGPETTPSGKFYLYGNPDSSVRAAMYSAYLPDLD
jgi:Inhibitor of vertebrate lysozyme (Ivy)